MSQDSSQTSQRWQPVRRQMRITEEWASFEHGAGSLPPAASEQAIVAWAHQIAQQGNTCWPAWSRRVDETRALAARLLGADKAEVALVHSTTEGISLVAEGFPWRDGDNVVTLANEF